jgi:hypothetical protein
LEIGTMRTLLSLGLLCFVAATAHAQSDSDREKPLGEDTVKVSDHVWQIVGWPNIGIVVGEKATLVVDTGLGPRNGATVVRLPTHSPAGDGSLVAKEKAFILDLRTRALGLKQQSVAADEAGRLLTEEFKKKYSDWPIKDVTNFVKSIYAE